METGEFYLGLMGSLSAQWASRGKDQESTTMLQTSASTHLLIRWTSFLLPLVKSPPAFCNTSCPALNTAAPLQFVPLDTHQYLLYHPSYEVLNPEWNFIFSRFDIEEKKMLDQISPLPEQMGPGETLLTPWQAFAGDLAHPVLTHWNMDTVYTFDQDKGWVSSYAFAFEGAKQSELTYGSQAEFDQLLREEKVCCIFSYTETKNFIYGMHPYKTYWGEHFLYSKRTGKLVQFSNDGLVNPFNGLEFILPVGSHYERDEIIFVAVPSRLHGQLAKNGDSFLPEAREAL